MSFKLSELQDIASDRGAYYFTKSVKGVGSSRDCHHSTLLSVNDALKNVDDVRYADPLILKATNGLAGGLGGLTGPCGIVSAGSIALSLKYGTSDLDDRETKSRAWHKSREWYLWFKKQFNSCDCWDLSFGTDFTDPEQRQAYYEGPRHQVCTAYLTQAIRKLVEMLTVEDPNVVRDS
jgi:hypothetical protein